MMHFSQQNRRRTLITSVLAVGIVAVTVAVVTTATAPRPAQAVPTPAAVSTPAPAVRASIDGWVAATAAGIPSARSLVVNADQLLPPGEMVTEVVLRPGAPAAAGELCFRADVTLTSPTETTGGIQTSSQSTTPYDILVRVQDPAFPVVAWARAFAGGAEATCG